MLRKALATAIDGETLGRNVASRIKLRRVETPEPEILTQDHIAAVLKALDGHRLYPVVALALDTGCRRAELLGLAWGLRGPGWRDHCRRAQP